MSRALEGAAHGARDWSGVLSFGLVALPVELYSATEAHRPVFHQFEEGTADRIRISGSTSAPGARSGTPTSSREPISAAGTT